MNKTFTSNKISKALPVRLKKEYWLICGFCGFGVWVAFFMLHSMWRSEYAYRWLLQTILILIYTLAVLWGLLPFNHRKDETVLLPTLGAGTLLTILRGLFISMLAGFLFLPWPGKSIGERWLQWLPGLLYLLAACADYLDGWLARMTNYETRLGEMFDTKMDALGLLAAPLLAISFGQLPVFYFAVSAAYYLLNAGRWVRKRFGKAVLDVHPWPGARLLAGFQMGFVGIVLLPLLTPPAATIAAIVFMIPFLSGFMRDWLITCGIIQQDSPVWKRQEQGIKIFLTDYTPLILRGLVACLLFFIIRNDLIFSYSIKFLGQEIMVITGFLLIFGVAGRLAGLLLSLVLGMSIQADTPGVLRLLFVCALLFMFTGTGLCSLWKPEERFLFKRAGEREDPSKF